jgi:hypothetical protein
VATPLMSHETDRKILKSAQQGYQNPLLYEYEYKWLYVLVLGSTST